MNLFKTDINRDKYFIVTYKLGSSSSLKDAALAVAYGQSVGNPHVRNKYEDDRLFQDHSCVILDSESRLENIQEGLVKIAFPIANMDFLTDGISQLFVQMLGGNLDIDIITKCRVKNVEFPQWFIEQYRLTPHTGLDVTRELTGVPEGKPILGGILKPKTGMTPDTLLDMVKEMVENGINWIKEDEILSNPNICPFRERVEKLGKYLHDKNIIYCVCINADPEQAVRRAMVVAENGINGVHLNWWCGLGTYADIRFKGIPVFQHFQSSGHPQLTDPRNPYGIDWQVLCYLMHFMGVDSCHVGMVGGYHDDNHEDIVKLCTTMTDNNAIPTLSCGFTPGLVEYVNKVVGTNYIANVGGALSGHPNGISGGVRAMRQAIDGNHGEDYQLAIDKWGLRE